MEFAVLAATSGFLALSLVTDKCVVEGNHMPGYSTWNGKNTQYPRTEQYIRGNNVNHEDRRYNINAGVHPKQTKSKMNLADLKIQSHSRETPNRGPHVYLVSKV
jgi:hypothetical protein